MRDLPPPQYRFPPKLVREMALLIGATEVMFEHSTAEGALKWMRGIESSLDAEPWADGKHSGDCTKTAHTCSRCYIEVLEHAADTVLGSEPFGFEPDDFPEWV